MAINTTLKELRQKKGMTQAEAAEFLGVNLSSYQKYERSKNTIIPSIDVLVQIADRYNVSLDYLLGRETPNNPLLALGIDLTRTDDDAFIKAYRGLPDYAKIVLVDAMRVLSEAAAGKEETDYGPMKHSAVTGDLLNAAEAEKDA